MQIQDSSFVGGSRTLPEKGFRILKSKAASECKFCRWIQNTSRKRIQNFVFRMQIQDSSFVGGSRTLQEKDSDF
jgi:hypothetical protein